MQGTKRLCHPLVISLAWISLLIPLPHPWFLHWTLVADGFGILLTTPLIPASSPPMVMAFTQHDLNMPDQGSKNKWWLFLFRIQHMHTKSKCYYYILCYLMLQILKWTVSLYMNFPHHAYMHVRFFSILTGFWIANGIGLPNKILAWQKGRSHKNSNRQLCANQL